MMKDEGGRMKGWTKNCLLVVLIWGVVLQVGVASAQSNAEKRAAIQERIDAYKINPAYKDDVYGLVVVKEAMQSNKEGSGGIGACLVDRLTGKVVERGRNRQYIDYFRSDLHAEMDLLNRYEERARKTRNSPAGEGIRDCPNLVLVTSVEPCPMCLTRIINAGIKKVLYVVEDKDGGMATRLDQLPPFWREFAADREFKKADCSPALSKIAYDLFHFSHRYFAKNKKK